jgi:hypothetical protein
MPTHPPWFEMPSPIDTEVGTVLMLEPPWASRGLLRAQLLDDILLAFRNPSFEPRWRWLHNHAKELRAKHGLDFPAFVRKIERSAKLGVAYRLRARDSW